MRVLCLTPVPTAGAGNRLRVEQYAAPLRAHGIELVVSPFFDDRTYAVLYREGHLLEKAAGTLRGILRRVRDAVRVGRYDLVLVYRESAPIGPPLFERYLRLRRRPYVFDFDDALFLAPVHPANRRWAWLRHPSRVAETTRGAVWVSTVNEYLAAWARRYNPDVNVVPTPVDTTRFSPAPHAARSPLVLGWSGSSTTAPYLRLLDDVLDALAGRVDLVVRVIGGSYAHDRVPVEEVPWTLASEAAAIADFDVGLLPEPDDAWTRGKGAFKALLYMACAVPVVASAIGVNPEIIPDGEVGYCVNDTAGWVAAIERLAADPALRARLGAAGRARVEARYSLAVQVPVLAALLRRAVGA